MVFRVLFQQTNKKTNIERNKDYLMSVLTRGNPGPGIVTKPQYRFNKTEQHTRTHKHTIVGAVSSRGKE